MKQNNNFEATLKSINTPQLTFVCVCMWVFLYKYPHVCVREHLQVDKFTSFALNFIRQLSQQTSGVLPALTATQMPTPSPPTLLQWPLLSCSFPMGRDSCQFSFFFLFCWAHTTFVAKITFFVIYSPFLPLFDNLLLHLCMCVSVSRLAVMSTLIAL